MPQSAYIGNYYSGNNQGSATSGPAQNIPAGSQQQPPTDAQITQSAHTESYHPGNNQGFATGGPTQNNYTVPPQHPPAGNPQNQNTNQYREGDPDDNRRYPTEIAIWEEVQTQ